MDSLFEVLVPYRDDWLGSPPGILFTGGSSNQVRANSLPVGVLTVLPSSLDLPKFVVRERGELLGSGAPPQPGPVTRTLIRVLISVELLRVWPPGWPWGAKAEIGQGSILDKLMNKMKVLRMGLPLVQKLSGLQESIFSLSIRP